MTVPDEAYMAAAAAYDQAVNTAMGNPPGSVLGEGGRRAWAEHPAFRAAVEAVWPLAVASTDGELRAAAKRVVDLARHDANVLAVGAAIRDLGHVLDGDR